MERSCLGGVYVVQLTSSRSEMEGVHLGRMDESGEQ